MLRSGELLVRNDTVLVLILVAEDLLDELVLVCLHLVGLLRLGSSCRPDLLNLWGKNMEGKLKSGSYSYT